MSIISVEHTKSQDEVKEYLISHISTSPKSPFGSFSTRRGGFINSEKLVLTSEQFGLTGDLAENVEELFDRFAPSINRYRVPSLEKYMRDKNLDKAFKLDLLKFIGSIPYTVTKDVYQCIEPISSAFFDEEMRLDDEYEELSETRQKTLDRKGLGVELSMKYNQAAMAAPLIEGTFERLERDLTLKSEYSLDLYLPGLEALLEHRLFAIEFFELFTYIMDSFEYTWYTILRAYSSRRAKDIEYFRPITARTYKVCEYLLKIIGVFERAYEKIYNSELYEEFSERFGKRFNELNKPYKQVMRILTLESELRPAESTHEFLSNAQKVHLEARAQDIPTPKYRTMALEAYTSPLAVKSYLESVGLTKKVKWSDIPLEQKVTPAMRSDISFRFPKHTPEDIAADYAELSAQEVLEIMLQLDLADSLAELKSLYRKKRAELKDPHWAFRDLQWHGTSVGGFLGGILNAYKHYTLAELTDRINQGKFGMPKKSRKMTPARLSELLREESRGEIDPSEYRGVSPSSRSNPLKVEDVEEDFEI